jgi:hypothetical protein
LALVHAEIDPLGEGECFGIQAKTVPARDWCEPFQWIETVRLCTPQMQKRGPAAFLAPKAGKNTRRLKALTCRP